MEVHAPIAGRKSQVSPGLSVIIPMHDEAANVEALVTEVTAALRHVPHELIIVDDASTDDTAGRVRACAGRAPRLRLIRLPRQSGQSTAVWAGAQAAQGAWLAMLDGDLQNDPADILRLLQVRDTSPVPPGLLIGHRVTRRDTWSRRLASQVANHIRCRCLGDATPDSGCGLKIIPRDVFVSLPYFDHMHRFMPALVRQLGREVRSVPVAHRARTAGRSKYGLLDRAWVGLVDLLGVAWLARRNRRCTGVEEALVRTRTGRAA